MIRTQQVRDPAAQREGFLLIPSPESLQAPTPPQRF
jgi:hypothetical protein